MRSESRRLTIRIVAESALIVASILLALAVEGWREDRVLERTRVQALERIRTEIEGNIAALERSLAYHEEVLSGAGDLMASPERWRGRPFWDVGSQMAPRGILPPDLRTTAWETAVATRAVALFEYDVSHTLAGYYGWQERGVSDTVQRLVDEAFRPDKFDPDRTDVTLPQMVGMMGELAAQERQLLEQARRVLAFLDEGAGRQ